MGWFRASAAILLCLLFGIILIPQLRSPRLKGHIQPGAGGRVNHTAGNKRVSRLPDHLIDFREKIVHLDLKGAPLSISYMESVFPLLRQMGATGLLVEYEDMFPYSGPLANLSARNHYSTDDIKRLLRAASVNQLTVMPLVPTFGHLEFSLKLEERVELREDPTNPQALCPSLDKSLQMVLEMISQVIDLHQGHITHLHIGSDEVYVIGKCPRCQKRMAANNWTTKDLFLDHTLKVVTAVKERGVQPVMWDDMLRHISPTDLAKYNGLTSNAEIMVWSYSASISGDTLQAMEKYASLHFPAVWAASAFKGGVSPMNQMPAYDEHLANHVSWAEKAKPYENRVNIRGIAITGWQRFDHFTPLCELFSASIPLLALCLAYLNKGSHDDKILADIKQQLKCNHPIPLRQNSPPLLECSYPGAGVYIAVQLLIKIQEKRRTMEAGNYYKAGLSPMNLSRNFSAPANVRGATDDIPAIQSLVAETQRRLQELSTITDNATLHEWTETFLNPEIAWIEGLLRAKNDLLGRRTWPRRPLYEEN